MAKALRTEDDHLTLCCEVCRTKLGVGTDAYVLRRQIIGPGVTETIKESWLCSRVCDDAPSLRRGLEKQATPAR